MKIAVIDSGIPESSKLNIVGKYKIFLNQNYDTYIRTDDVNDENGHSTIVMRILEKYLEKEEVISIKILNKNLFGNSIALARGIMLAVEERCDLINISLGTTNITYIEEIKRAVKYAVEKDIIIIAAHSNNLDEISYPASFEDVIGVIGIDKEIEYIDSKKNNIIMANKQKIYDGNESIEIFGSSYCAPHITGILCKLLGDLKKSKGCDK